MKAKYFIDIEFSYNADLGVLQSKTKSNLEFLNSLHGNDIISYEDYAETKQKIKDYFREQFQKGIENPDYFIV